MSLTTETCGEAIRGFPGATCQLPKGHKGRRADKGRKARPGHSCVVFFCDGCSTTHRGQPHEYAQDGAPWENCFLQFCFMCVEVKYR